MHFKRIIWFITGVVISSCSEETFTREFCLQNVPAAEIQEAVPISSTSVFVRWTVTGAVTGINVEYIGVTTGGAKNIRLPGEDRSYEIKDLLPFTNYSINITPLCRFEEGMSSNGKPDNRIVRTFSGVPSVPTEIKVLSIFPNNVRLIWKKPRETRGAIAGYCVDYMTDTPGIDGNTKCIESNEPKITLSGLLPGQKYHVTVYAFNYNEETDERIYGNHSKTSFTTKAEPPNEPKNLQTITVESRKIVLKWDALEQYGENIIKYNVTCKSKESSKTDTTNATIITLHNLIPWTEYYIEVKGIVRELPGPAASIRIRTEKDEQHSCKPITKSEYSLYAYCCGTVIKAVIYLKNSPGASHHDKSISYKVVFMKDGSTENNYIINEQIKCKVCNGSESSSATCTAEASKQLNVSSICESSSDSVRVLRADIFTYEEEQLIGYKNSKVDVILKDEKRNNTLWQVLVLSCFTFVIGAMLVLFIQTFVRYTKEKKKFKMLIERLHDGLGHEILRQ